MNLSWSKNHIRIIILPFWQIILFVRYWKCLFFVFLAPHSCRRGYFFPDTGNSSVKSCQVSSIFPSPLGGNQTKGACSHLPPPQSSRMQMTLQPAKLKTIKSDIKYLLKTPKLSERCYLFSITRKLQQLKLD